ncbi:hypothetical protein Tco_0769851 [Tanacetum coccineum]|uniref:Uncharacterized protein n=1 Tax=Tanacetum coccineum TaxID=301880 RepID=A0ABQ4ZBJ3_9ASTR
MDEGKPVSEVSEAQPLSKRAEGRESGLRREMLRSDRSYDEKCLSYGRSGNQDGGQAGLDHGTLDEGQAGSDPGTRDEGQAGSNPGTLDEDQAGSALGTRDEGQAGPNPDDTNIAESLPLPTPSVLAGPDLELSVVEITGPSSQPQPEHMDEGFTASSAIPLMCIRI